MELRDDERAMLETSGRCKACGHLDALHHWDDEECMIDECPCAFGSLPLHGPERNPADRYQGIGRLARIGSIGMPAPSSAVIPVTVLGGLFASGGPVAVATGPLTCADCGGSFGKHDEGCAYGS